MDILLRYGLKIVGRAWPYLLILTLGVSLWISMGVAGKRAAAIDELNGRVAEAEANTQAWQAAYNTMVALSIETAKARAAESQTITIIRDAAGTAKEEISNAPGADDPFRYSDGAYRFMRARPGADASPAPPAAGMGGR